MPTIPIRGIDYDVDVEGELRQFDWVKPRWTDEKLIAASPFRYDNKPSFFVRLQPHGRFPAGVWADLGAYDDEWKSGNFVKLLSFLRNETYEETEDYLRTKYGFIAGSDEIVLRPPRLKLKRERRPLSIDVQPMVTDYLSRRGIGPDIQRLFGVGYDERTQAVMLPWRLPDGRLANVKYRKVYGKAFWYVAEQVGGWPIRELVYGIDVVYSHNVRTAALVEAEIDAMSFWTADMPAIAVGGASFGRVKLDVILRSPIEELIIATDNDKAGEKLRTEIERELRGKLRLKHARFDGVKDANEALQKYGVGALKSVVENADPVRGVSVKIKARN